MTRDEFEAALWRKLGGYATPALIDAILAAAGDYALTEYGITADRRAVLAGISARRMHYIPFDGAQDESACHPSGASVATTDPDAVTCVKCLRTDAYKADAALRRPA